jgi:SAM-dependent methyltransferase
VEKTPFADKEFDFVYCSHVLEHVQNPETACSELMRIGKRGYIECPTRGKDTFFHTAKASNHAWAVECLNGALVFTEYSEGEINGIECDILMQMICRPQNMREKALAALARIKAATLNTMLLWEDSFPYEVRRQKVWPAHIQGPKDIRDTQQCLAGGPPLRGTSFFPKLRWGINVFRSKLARYIEPGA